MRHHHSTCKRDNRHSAAEIWLLFKTSVAIAEKPVVIGAGVYTRPLYRRDAEALQSVDNITLKIEMVAPADLIKELCI